MENRKTIEKINSTKSWFFEKINGIDKEGRLKLPESEMKEGALLLTLQK